MAECISVVGLGRLGLCLAACLAEKGFAALGVDVDENVVAAVNRGMSPVVEPGLDALIARHGGANLRATLRHRDAIEETGVTFVLVATPSNGDGSFSNRHVEPALRALGGALRASSKESHLFVISSTVMPGACESSFIPLLQESSGRRLNQGFAVCYDPEFVALGNVINGFLQPDLVVIGESNAQAGASVEAMHRQMCENNPAISHMSIVSAEIAKVCLNAYITLKISFANSVANLCERIPGSDVDAITGAIGADRRISPYYLRGGPSFGGLCFPRDVQAYMALAGKYGVQADLMRAVEQVNQAQDRHLLELVLREMAHTEKKTVGVLGLAFTANTPVVTESSAVKLIAELLQEDVHVVAYDPLAIENTRALFGNKVDYADSAASCLAQAGVCVITLRSPELKQAVETFVPAHTLTVVDCWRIINVARLDRSVSYIALGRAQDYYHTPGRRR